MENIGTSKDVRRVFRLLDTDEVNNISRFCSACSNRSYRAFLDSDIALIHCDNGGYSEDVKDVFKNYSGFNYRRINASARGKWNYEKHGHSKERERFDEIAISLRNAIDDNQKSIGNVKVFRGVPLSYFADYGITSLEDLESLEGGFLLDRGFVSTSLVEDDCYYKKENELGLNYNVKIEYLVPEEFEDGVSIGNVSYSPGQNEYLINAWNIANVSSVRMDGEDGAVITALLIPKTVYDKAYRHEAGTVK